MRGELKMRKGVMHWVESELLCSFEWSVQKPWMLVGVCHLLVCCVAVVRSTSSRWWTVTVRRPRLCAATCSMPVWTPACDCCIPSCPSSPKSSSSACLVECRMPHRPSASRPTLCPLMWVTWLFVSRQIEERVLCQSFSGFVATDVEGLVSEL